VSIANRSGPRSSHTAHYPSIIFARRVPRWPERVRVSWVDVVENLRGSLGFCLSPEVPFNSVPGHVTYRTAATVVLPRTEPIRVESEPAHHLFCPQSDSAVKNVGRLRSGSHLARLTLRYRQGLLGADRQIRPDSDVVQSEW